jgi:hypothetical protein
MHREDAELGADVRAPAAARQGRLFGWRGEQAFGAYSGDSRCRQKLNHGLVVVLALLPVRQQLQDGLGNGKSHSFDLFIRRRRQGKERKTSVFIVHEHAIGKHAVAMNV